MKDNTSIQVIQVPNKEKFYVSEVARLFNRSRRTIYNWINQGDIEAQYIITEHALVIYRNSILKRIAEIERTRQP